MAGGGGGSEYEVNINLTALLDVLTNLLFFLMLGAAAQSANMELDSGMVLPDSSADVPATKTISVTIGTKDLRVEKDPIASVRAGHVNGAPAEGRIDALYKRLMSVKNDKSSKTLEVSDVVLVFCDKDTPYALVRQVLNTAAEAGFIKFRMAVLME